MNTNRGIRLLFLFCSFAPSWAQNGTCNGMSTGPGANLNGFIPFAANNLWNTDISNAVVDPNSQNIINFIGSSTTLHPDFGAGLYNGGHIGIPYQVEDSTQALTPIKLMAYGAQSDPGPARIPANALIEGYPHPGSGDRHVLVLDKTGCWLYEIYHAHPLKNGSWSGDSTALWDMTTNETRPYTWTSADAAGLPIFVGLVRYDEVAAGSVKHAFRFTVATSREAFVLPATHWASSVTNPDAPPMGTRLRLKASFDTSHFSAANQVILIALKHYGMILADNGSSIYLGGAPDDRWNNDDLSHLKLLTGADFEVVQQGTIYTPSNIPHGAKPAISSFNATPKTVAAGAPVTLTWQAGGAEYVIVTPSVGALRGTSAVVYPSTTTIYELDLTNQYGRAAASVTVTVQ
jgi:hypothetical protein